VREFDRAFADRTRGGPIDSTIYTVWYQRRLPLLLTDHDASLTLDPCVGPTL